MPPRLTVPALVLALLLGAWWRSHEPTLPPPLPAAPPPALPTSPGSPALLPLPEPPAQPEAQVALGRRLFSEPRLSRDGSVSCASCHDLAHNGADRQDLAVGIAGQRGARNTPTVFNAALNLAQFWDGRVATLEQQVAGPVHNPLEMGSTWAEVVARLGADPSYVDAFGRLYPEGISGASIADAISRFERTLLTPGSRLDRHLRGEAGALDAREQAGLRRFLALGCAACHQGAGIGGNMFQRFGVLEPPDPRRAAADPGRYAVTGRDDDRSVFKVPSLRNVALTAPYFHDGSAATLEDAVRTMGRVQLGRALDDEDVGLLVAFLGTLTGTWQGRALE